MKIHQVALRHVRHIRKLDLDLSAPLTVIGGPNGSGKTTLQKALLLAMFMGKKEARDDLKSLYDPHTPPQVILHLSHGDPQASIRFERSLLDDKGEWEKGGVVIKKKGEALKKIQEELPISADTAALVLWGLQEDIAGVVREFPSDGHSLLTRASIKGTGPDPNGVIQELEKEADKARKGGEKDPGSLFRAGRDVKKLETELDEARTAEKARDHLKKTYDDARATLAQAESRRDLLKAEVQRLANLEGLLDHYLRASVQVVQLENQQRQWDKLEEKIVAANKELAPCQAESLVLQSELRVARDRDLGTRIDQLRLQIEAVRQAEEKRARIEEALHAVARPGESEEKLRCDLQAAIDQNENKMTATGVRYALMAEKSPRSVLVSEDGEAPRKIDLAPGRPHQGVVGGVVVQSNDLRIEALGKEDIAGLKRSIEKFQADLAALFKKFAVQNDRQFEEALQEKRKLEKALDKAEQAVKDELKGATLSWLEGDLRLADKGRQENKVTQKDKDDCQSKHLGSVQDLNVALAAKKKEIELVQKNVSRWQGELPGPQDRAQLDGNLKAARQQVDHARTKFEEAKGEYAQPNSQFLEEVKKTLGDKRKELEEAEAEYHRSSTEVARLASDLKHSGPSRPIAGIEADLETARDLFQREQVLQEGRTLLKQRIEEKIGELTAGVPRELSTRIGAHLARMTSGVYGKVSLSRDFTLAGVEEAAVPGRPWEPRRLSTGERCQAALAVKVAVARALADADGTVFIILDDSLACFDPNRRAATEALLLDLVADGKLQVIFLTCHTDWTQDWQRRQPSAFQAIDLVSQADYYRARRSVVEDAAGRP